MSSTFSVIVPAPQDEADLEATLARLAASDDPPSEVLLVVGDDDPRARAAAERSARRHPGLVKVIGEAALFDGIESELPPEARAPSAGRRVADWADTQVAGRLIPALSRAGTELAGAVAAWRARRDRGDIAALGDPGSFSVMVPAPHDADELEATLAQLAASDDPPSEVLVVVGTGDAEARAIAEQASARHPGFVNVVAEAALFDEPAGDRARRAFGRVAAHVPWRPLVQVLAVAVVAIAVLAAIRSGSFVYLLYVGLALVLGAIAWTTLIWMLYAWRTPTSLVESGLNHNDLPTAFSFSLIVPARHEEAVLEATLSRLVTGDHPDFEIVVVVGDDDPGTREVAERVADRHPDRVKVVVDDSSPKSKPKALNAALPYCSGAITGVFDAEDDVHPALLQRVDQCFQRTHADVVQAGVQLMNFRSSWLTVRNVLEYYFWFRSRLHFHAAQGFIPLGGNTVFIRTQLLRAVAGWDPECLAEDCELGVRLSAFGAHTVVFYEPELVTREECPPTLGAFARQRTRWSQGYLQTLQRGYWRRLPLRQRALGAYTLAMPYLMALVWLTIPVAIVTAVAVKAPVPITLVSFLPALPMLSMLAVEVAALGEFCRTYGERASVRDYLRLVVGLPVYQSVLAFAAARAVAREARGDRGWEKTPHLGLHLPETADEELEEAGSSIRVLRGGGDRSEGTGASVRVLEPPAAHVAVLDHDHGNGSGRAVGGGDGNGNGDGHWGGGDWPADELFEGFGDEPLWAQLEALSGDGSASVSAPRTARLRGSWLPDVHAFARTAVRSHADILLVAGLLFAVGLVQATNLLHWPETQFDEGTYMSNAWAVQHGALAPYTYSYGHPPLTWLLIALWTSVRGIFGDASFSIDNGREFMLVVTLVSCSLLYTVARRIGMSRPFAAVAVILFALSPVGLWFHRAVLLDNVAIAWALAAFALALTPRHRLWAFAASGACFAASVLSKETTLVLLPALILAAAQNADKRTRRYCVTLFGSFLALTVIIYPLYAALKGELVPGAGHVSLIGYSVVQLVTREATGSLFDPASQTHAIVNAWLGLDPWLLGAALVLSPIALARRGTRAPAAAFLIQVVMVLRPGYLPNMYVIGLLPFAALIVSGGTEALWRKSRLTSSRASAWLLRAATAAVAIVALLVVAPRWAHKDHVATTAQLDQRERAAKRWLVGHVGHDKRLIVGDEFWLYLVQHGFDHHPVRGGFFSRTVVVYWPLDYDPAVKKRFPNGWRDFDYLVSTQAVRSTLRLTPTTARAIDHSRVVAQFGRGAQRIEIRRITGAQRFD